MSGNGPEPLNFIHIPRTAGRFVVEQLLANGFAFNFQEGHKYHFSSVVDGFEVMHFHAGLITKHFPNNCSETFSIIRDPVDRFLSGFNCLATFAKQRGLSALLYSGEIAHVLKSAQGVENNWFRPQTEFLLPTTHTWNFSDGFGDDFFGWLEERAGCELRNRVRPYKQNIFDSRNKPTLPACAIAAVRDFYSADYDLLFSAG